MDVYRNVGNDALAQVYAEETLRLGVSAAGIERSPMRNAEARITLGVIAERNGDHQEALSQGFAALSSARKCLPSLQMVAAELVSEFRRSGHADDQDVRQFEAALLAGSTPQPDATP